MMIRFKLILSGLKNILGEKYEVCLAFSFSITYFWVEIIVYDISALLRNHNRFIEETIYQNFEALTFFVWKISFVVTLITENDHCTSMSITHAIQSYRLQTRGGVIG